MAIMKLLSVSLLFALMQTKSAFAKDDEDKKKKSPDNNTSRLQVHVRNKNLNDSLFFYFDTRLNVAPSSVMNFNFKLVMIIIPIIIECVHSVC